jgi:carboxypeptidase Taq
VAGDRGRATFDELKRRLAEVHDLGKAIGLLGWDQRTMMPSQGGGVRAEQLATLSRLAHDRFVDDEIGRMLDDVTDYGESLPYDSDEASLIRVVRRDYDRERRVPADLRSDLARAASNGYEAWVDARARSDYASFMPYLEKTVELRRRYAECFDADEPYDALLDDYEPGMKAAEVREVFDVLKPELIGLVRAVADRQEQVDNSFLKGSFSVERQRELSLAVLERLGFEHETWRLDTTVHPFAMSLATSDIRLTTRFKGHDVSDALFSTMHEFGHGVYERNVDPALERTPLCRGASMSLHESQSRLWENLVGRSRQFWGFFYPTFRSIFPEFDAVDEDSFYRGINKVDPSFIRVEADEVTYSLHIILRFELEQELLSGELGLRELPETWNARMEEYLGVVVEDDAHGVLQDTHWSATNMGYFPTYALGNVVSLQIWEQALTRMPDLYDQIGRGEFFQLREWLRDQLYRHGRKLTPKELIERITGGGMDPAPYIRYLSAKVGEVYGIEASLAEDGARP